MNVGCKLGIFSSNIIAYADDIVLLAPSSFSLQLLLDEAIKYGLTLELKMNIKKTKCLTFRCSKKSIFGNQEINFHVDRQSIESVTSIKYLGFIINNTLNDDNDIDRVRSKFYSEFNSLLRNFNFADTKVKLFLFRQYCLQFYGCELWLDDRCSTTSLKQFSVGFHKAVKKLMNLSYHESNHFACQEANLFTFKHFLNKSKIMQALRFLMKPCDFISKNMGFFSLSSFFLKNTYVLLDKFYGLDSLLLNDKDAIVARIGFIQNHEPQMRTHW